MSVEGYLIWKWREEGNVAYQRKGLGLHRRRPEGERIEGRGCWGPGLVEKTSEEQRPHINMGAAAEEEEEEEPYSFFLN